MLGNAELLGRTATLAAPERARLTMIDEAGASAVRACRALGNVAGADATGEGVGMRFGDLLDAERDVLARIAGTGWTFAAEVTAAARASVPEAAAGEALGTILHALVLLARPGRRPRGALTLHARLDDSSGGRAGRGPADPRAAALELHVDTAFAPDGQVGETRGETGGGGGMPGDAAGTDILEALVELAVRVGGHRPAAVSGEARAPRVVLPARPGTATR